MRHRIAALLIAAMWTVQASAQPAQAEEDPTAYGLQSVSAAVSDSQAATHPDLTVAFDLTRDAEGFPFARLRDLTVDLPPGLVGNPNVAARCSARTLALQNSLVAVAEEKAEHCPQDSQIGIVTVELPRFLGPGVELNEPLYNMAAPGGDAVARIGFVAVIFPIFINVDLRSATDYGLSAKITGAPSGAVLGKATTVIWGVPADATHDGERFNPTEAVFCNGACEPKSSGLGPKPFMSDPTSCGPAQAGFKTDSYALPGQFSIAEASLGEIESCDKVQFNPTLSIAPTSETARAPTGLDANLQIPQSEATNTLATSHLRDARVTLPEGMTISPGAADGLAACSDTQVGFKEEVASNCPEAAKLGSATFVSPALERPLHGSIYQRAPEPEHLFRLWLVADELGVHLKLPGEVEADPNTGQLTTTFEDTPQLPVEKIALHFKSGARAPLKNPDDCGAFQTHYVLTPWSGNPPTIGDAPMTIDEGCAADGFSPRLDAGTVNPVAGSRTPFVAKLTREDGEQNVADIDVGLPQGELAKLAGVAVCPEAQAPTGDCPAGSQVGSVAVAVGSGSLPLWIPQPGKADTAVYLGGPYKSAPYSLVFKVPAQAGPFDLGTVVTRAGIYVDPETTRVTVKSDPLPQILEGVPIQYRTIHVDVDKPNFAMNPTNCETMAVTSTITSDEGTTANPSSRFQVGGCGELGFKPKLSFKLMGKTNRGAHPALRATLNMPKHGANIGRAVVALPHSEFLDQGHIRTICTRVQFAAEECPAGSVYGHARAVTPLLDQPLEGPVYLRSSSHKLPDLVADLRGQIHVVLDGRIDSTKDGGLRSTFAKVPDAPVSKFTLTMLGGVKGLLNNSEGLCGQTHRAIANFTGQNGKIHDFRPVVQANCRK